MAYMNDDWYVVKDAGGVVIQNTNFEAEVADDFGTWVRLPQDVFDALALMRYAELREDLEGMLVKRLAVAEKYQNLGTEALRRWAGLPPLIDLE